MPLKILLFFVKIFSKADQKHIDKGWNRRVATCIISTYDYSYYVIQHDDAIRFNSGSYAGYLYNTNNYFKF